MTDQMGEGIVLTFDMDWCSDQVLAAALDRVERAGVAATFFVTHDTPLLARMRENPLIELGIHPNYNKLLDGVSERPEAGFRGVVTDLIKIVPEAASTRSHALTTNSVILSAYASLGIKREVNWYIPLLSGMGLRPFYHFDHKLIRIPFFFEDDAHCAELDNGFPLDWDADKWLSAPSMPYKVFNFHPIHLFINTETTGRYQSARPFLRDLEALKTHVNLSCPGTADFFDRVVQRGKERGMAFLKTEDVAVLERADA